MLQKFDLGELFKVKVKVIFDVAFHKLKHESKFKVCDN